MEETKNLTKNLRGAKQDLSWREIVADYKGSGWNASEYCKRNGVSKPDLSKAVYTYDSEHRAQKDKVSKQIFSSSILEVSNQLLDHQSRKTFYRVELELGDSMVLRIR